MLRDLDDNRIAYAKFA